jgi:hypothetical protein
LTKALSIRQDFDGAADAKKALAEIAKAANKSLPDDGLGD